MSMIHKATAATLAATTLLTVSGCTQKEAVQINEAERNADGNYNILFITTDQEHYFEEFPENSNYRARQLLQELGTTFEKHYACANMSTSSRSTIFTGTHVPDTKMSDNTDFAWQDAMDENRVTIGDMMRNAGDYTALKGKWHLGDASLLDSDAAQMTDLEGYGFADWGGKDYIGDVQEGYQKDPVIISEAVEWLGSKGRQLNADGTSFFLTVNLVNPHDIMNYNITGYQSPFLKLAGKPDDEIYDKTYSDAAPASWDFDLNGEDVPQALRLYQAHWGRSAGTISDEATWKDYQDYYYNCIQDSDNNLMELLDYLTESKMLDNTIIVFTSDHGEMHGSHGLQGKGGFVYENNIHVPLIIVHPDYEGGKHVSSVTSHIDLAPTFVDMTNLSEEAKAEITGELPGSSLLPLIEGTETTVRSGALFCYEMLSMTSIDMNKGEDGNFVYSLDPTARGMVRGLITENYKFVRYFSPLDYQTPATMEELFGHNDVQLFDLKNDPEELNNLAADPEANGKLIMELNAELNRLIESEIGTDDGAHVAQVVHGLQAVIQ